MTYKSLLFCMLLNLILLSSCMTKLPDKDNSDYLSIPKGVLPPGTVREKLSPPRVEVHYVYSKDDGHSFYELRDGEELHSGDKYRVEFIPQEDCYIHIYQAESQKQYINLTEEIGKNFDNKVMANRKYYFPSPTETLVLDENPGIEILYFIASRGPNNNFEKNFPPVVKGAVKGTGKAYDIECVQECIKKVKFKHVYRTIDKRREQF